MIPNCESSGCDWRRRPPDMEEACKTYWICSREQPTRGGGPAWGRARLTTPNPTCYEMLRKALNLETRRVISWLAECTVRFSRFLLHGVSYMMIWWWFLSECLAENGDGRNYRHVRFSQRAVWRRRRYAFYRKRPLGESEKAGNTSLGFQTSRFRKLWQRRSGVQNVQIINWGRTNSALLKQLITSGFKSCFGHECLTPFSAKAYLSLVMKNADLLSVCVCSFNICTNRSISTKTGTNIMPWKVTKTL